MTSSGTGSELAFDYANNELEFSNNTKSVFGDGGDLEIFFDGTHSKIDHTPTSGSLFLAGDSLVLSNSGMSQYYLQAVENGAVSLNYSGSTKLATSNTGISITGIPVATQSTGNIGLELHATGSGRGSQIKLHNDHGVAYVGTAGDTTGDLLIYNETSSNTIFYTAGTERLRIQPTGIVKVETSDSSSLNAHLVVNNSESNSGVSLIGSGSSFSEGGWAAVTDAGIIRSSHNSSNGLVLQAASGDIRFYAGGSPPAERLRITSNGHVTPGSNNTQDLGSTAKGWRNIYTNDLNLSNMNGEINDIDGTQGSWTIQEGKDDLYIINRLNGKKFKIKMEEVS